MRRMKRRHRATLTLIFVRTASGDVKWRAAESLLATMGATFKEAEGSRDEVRLFNMVRVVHRPHPSSNTYKGAISLRVYLDACAQDGIAPLAHASGACYRRCIVRQDWPPRHLARA